MDPKMMMQVPDAVRDLAEKSVDQAEKAFNAFLDAANKSVAVVPHPGTEISKKTLSMAEQNMKAAFEHARKLLHAKDFQSAMQLQTEFLKQQFAAARDQMKQFNSQTSSDQK